jgi:hypothetical protein
VFPWLEELRVHHVPKSALRSLARGFRLLRSAFPKLKEVALSPVARLGIESNGKIEELREDRTVLLDAPTAGSNPLEVRSADRFVRWSQGVPMLCLTDAHFLLNGRAQQRPPRVTSWMVPLRVGDVFGLGASSWKVLALD